MRQWLISHNTEDGTHKETVAEGGTQEAALAYLQKHLGYVPSEIYEVTDAPFALRMYYFTLRHLGALHRGIQADHAQSEIWLKYDNEPFGRGGRMLRDWAKYYKTVVVLDGGTSEDLRKLFETLSHRHNPGYPWASFREPDMENCRTAIGVILPPEIYTVDSREVNADDDEWKSLTPWQQLMVELKSKCKLASAG